MKIEIEQFVLDNLFHHVPATDNSDEFWYRETTDEDGWVMVWADGNHHHTYRFPPDINA